MPVSDVFIEDFFNYSKHFIFHEIVTKEKTRIQEVLMGSISEFFSLLKWSGQKKHGNKAV